MGFRSKINLERSIPTPPCRRCRWCSTAAQDKVKTAHAEADKQQQAKVAQTRAQITNHEADTLVKHEKEIQKLDQQSGDKKKATIGKINTKIS